MKNYLKQKLLGGLVFSFGLIIGLAGIGIIYSSWSGYNDLPNTNAGSGLTNNIWNNMVAMINKSVKQDSEIITVDNTNGRIGIGTISPSSKLEVNGTIKASGLIYGRLSGEWEFKTIMAGACISGANAQSARFITITTTSGQNCSSACSASMSGASCVWGSTIWNNNWQYYGYNYECSTGVNYQQGSSGYVCCCSNNIAAIYPIK